MGGDVAAFESWGGGDGTMFTVGGSSLAVTWPLSPARGVQQVVEVLVVLMVSAFVLVVAALGCCRCRSARP